GWCFEESLDCFRTLNKEEDRVQAKICLNEQHDLSFYYLRISSRAQDGNIWTTLNYPLSYGLKLSPHFRINRQRPDQSFWQLYQSHKAFLRDNGIDTDRVDHLNEDQIQEEIEKDLHDQIAHKIQTDGVANTA